MSRPTDPNAIERGDRSGIVLSKVRPPTSSWHLVRRPRLEARLSAGLHGTVVLVAGHPGAGASALLAQWAAERRPPVAWVTVDRRDDASTFWRHVGAAAAIALPRHGEHLDGLLAAGAGSAPERAEALVEDLGEQRLAMVVDGLHTADGALDDALAALVARAPGHLVVVLGTRHDPPLPLLRLRRERQLVEIRGPDLALTMDETAEVLGLADAGAVSRDDVALLHQRTEGWAAAVLLAARVAAASNDPPAALKAIRGDDGDIAAFIRAELLGRQPAELQDFLVATSILTQLSPALVGALEGSLHVGSGASGALLERLGRRNLLVPVDGEGGWSRYHTLVREYLRAELEARAPGQAADVHRAAAAWLRARGEHAGALDHLLAAGEHAGAFALLRDHIHPWALSEEAIRPQAWFARFPAGFLAGDPDRANVTARGHLLEGRLREAAAWLDRAQALVDAEPSAPPAARVAVSRTWLHQLRGDAGRAADEGDRALELLGADGPGHERALAHNALSWAHYALGDRTAARGHWLAAGAEPHPPASSAEVVRPAMQAVLLLDEGRLGAALDAAETALAGAASLGLPRHHFALDARLVRAAVLRERGGAPAARVELEALLVTARRRERRAIALEALVELALTDRALGDPLAGAQRLAAAHPVGDDADLPARLLAWSRRTQALLLLQAGEVDRAGRVAALVPPSSATELLHARMALERGDAPGALPHLDAVDPHDGDGRTAIDLALVQARTAVLVGHRPAAVAHVRRALDLARDDGHVQRFRAEGPDVLAIVADLARRDPFAATIAGGARTAAPSPAAPGQPLTARELAVLRRLSGTATNVEISRALYISPNTLKSHLRTLYRKLGASSRREAVTTARHLGLLDGPRAP